jgi:hypothetical protein
LKGIRRQDIPLSQISGDNFSRKPIIGKVPSRQIGRYRIKLNSKAKQGFFPLRQEQ